MNDPGLDESLQESLTAAQRQLQGELKNTPGWRTQRDGNNGEREDEMDGGVAEGRGKEGEPEDEGNTAEQVEDILMDEEEGYFQPTVWWFTSTAFPLIAGTFGPISNLFSVCALVQTWRVNWTNGQRISDPKWLIALNTISLALALIANFILLSNFAHRIRYSIAQPLTITLWYLSSILLVIPLALIHHNSRPEHAFSQSFYYALLSAILYAVLSTVLLMHTLGSTLSNNAYPKSFAALTIPQRMLMLQTIFFSLYLALGAGVFARLEGWAFVDALYWADYTLLTIGLGSDFPLSSVAGRMLLIPFAALGITIVGIVVGSVRGLVLERAKVKVMRRKMGKERELWLEKMKRRKSGKVNNRFGPKNIIGNRVAKIPDAMREIGTQEGTWKKAEFELMRRIEKTAEKAQRYTGLAVSFFAFVVVWIGGSVVFYACEKKGQDWSYPSALFFAYTSLLTIGYGDFTPTSAAGKPFFVLWSLVAVPTVTVLISNMGDTVVRNLGDIAVIIGRWTVLPESDDENDTKKKKKRQMHRNNTMGGSSSSGSSSTSSSLSEDSERMRGLGSDVENLGEAVERAEETQGRGDSLAARLAREISGVARDVGRKPPKQYEWEEWKRWLSMLGEHIGPEPAEGGKNDKRRNSEDDQWTWTWLSDNGPLFSRDTETEWILGKLCKRLEEVLESELKEANSV